MHPILAAQLADDYCCTVQQVQSREHVFSVLEMRDGQRRYKPQGDPFKAACVNGKLLIAGSPEMVAWCRERHHDGNAAWFMEMDVLRELDNQLALFSLRIGSAHPFFLRTAHAPRMRMDHRGVALTFYEQADIEQFRGDPRFPQSYAFNALAPDVLGVSASMDGEIVAMAGASRDSARMWQIGVDVLPAYQGRGLGAYVVHTLACRVESRGALPFYGTSMSHIASQKTALRAGFEPAWVELYAQAIDARP